MPRRLVAFVAVAACLLALALWARARDVGSPSGGWSPPSLAFGERRAQGALAGNPELEWGVVACTVDGALGEDPGRLLARNEEDGTAVSAASGRTLTLTLAPGEWQVTWRGAGTGGQPQSRRLGLVELDAGQVERCAIGGTGWTLSGNVLDDQGEPQVGAIVEGCGAEVESGEAGRFTLTAARGDCLVRAWATDGLLRRPSEPLYFDAFDPPVSPTFRVPGGDIGGVGLGLRGAADGLHVDLVTPDGPGDLADVARGDIIVAVDGAETAGWSVIHGVEVITGTPGTRIRLRIRRGTEAFDLDLVRARIEESTTAVVDTGRAE